MNQFSNLETKLDQLNQNLKINSFYTNTHKFNTQITNNINNQQELKFDNGRYVGQVVNGLREGKGIIYFNNGDRYEGDFRNGKSEGKGIYYYNTGDKYEGDFRNDKREGKGIMYYHNGDRMMGDYYNGKAIGKHVMLTRNGEVKTYNGNEIIIFNHI